MARSRQIRLPKNPRNKLIALIILLLFGGAGGVRGGCRVGGVRGVCGVRGVGRVGGVLRHDLISDVAADGPHVFSLDPAPHAAEVGDGVPRNEVEWFAAEEGDDAGCYANLA